MVYMVDTVLFWIYIWGLRCGGCTTMGAYDVAYEIRI
jgi:hypothetical protein